jgi:hypothetical protein
MVLDRHGRLPHQEQGDHVTANSNLTERSVTVTLGGFDDVNEALAWIVQHHDAEFGNATFVKIHIEQYMVADEGPDGGPQNWRPTWTASISGMTETPVPHVTG